MATIISPNTQIVLLLDRKNQMKIFSHLFLSDRISLFHSIGFNRKQKSIVRLEKCQNKYLWDVCLCYAVQYRFEMAWWITNETGITHVFFGQNHHKSAKHFIELGTFDCDVFKAIHKHIQIQMRRETFCFIGHQIAEMMTQIMKIHENSEHFVSHLFLRVCFFRLFQEIDCHSFDCSRVRALFVLFVCLYVAIAHRFICSLQRANNITKSHWTLIESQHTHFCSQ